MLTPLLPPLPTHIPFSSRCHHRLQPSIRHPWPVGTCLQRLGRSPHAQPGPLFLRRAKQGTLQFVLIKVATTARPKTKQKSQSAFFFFFTSSSCQPAKRTAARTGLCQILVQATQFWNSSRMARKSKARGSQKCDSSGGDPLSGFWGPSPTES